MSYDNWKLSNPIDDGFYTEMVSECCGTHYAEEDDIYTCSECDNDCEITSEDDYRANQRDSWLEMMRDGEKDEC